MTEHIFCNWTVSSKAAEAEELARAIAASSVKVKTVAGFVSVKPLPKRSNRIDPETVLKRKVAHVKPLHYGTYLDRYDEKKRNRETLSQVWA